ncbi:MAG: hypothetical protein M5U14_15445 [Acidimicrobiia bacterium]|nr:hypothetical protein [Acidimicrobiia bacterium]
MVSGLAFLATAVSTLFAQATLVRWTRRRRPHDLAWAVALAMFALASAALATGASTGWDTGTFRAFYLLGAITNVPWLALGTVYLLLGPAVGRRVQWGLVAFTGLAFGVMLAAPVSPVPTDSIPVGKEVLGALPRILAAIGSGVGALVIFAGAAWSALRYLRRREAPGAARLAAANGLIALGTLVLSGGGLIQGVVGDDEAFAISLASGVSVIYAGFLVAAARDLPARVPSVRPVDVGGA